MSVKADSLTPLSSNFPTALELSHLRTKQTPQEEIPALVGTAIDHIPQNPEQKVELFLSLFQARSSVYPKRWENSHKGTKGYSPACRNEWVKELCGLTSFSLALINWRSFASSSDSAFSYRASL